MMVGFILWSLVALIVAGIGAGTWKAKKAVFFFAGVKPPTVSNVRQYNRSVAVLWFVYAGLLESLGLPLLFLKQHAAGILVIVLGVPAVSIGLVIAYNRILQRYQIRR